MEVLEDIRALLDEDQESTVDTVKVSNRDSYFMCNRDNPLLKPLSIINPTAQAYKDNLQNRESGEKEIGEEEIREGEVVEVGEGSEWERSEQDQQLVEQDTKEEDLVEMVESMGLSLVPRETMKNTEASFSVRKNGRVRELQNLEFNVNFKNSEFRRGTYNSK